MMSTPPDNTSDYQPEFPLDRPHTRSHQFDAAQLRRDTWNELQFHARWLAQMAREPEHRDQPRDVVRNAIDTLRILEMYWAFPGMDVLDDLDRLYQCGEYDALAKRSADIARLLVSDGYRETSVRNGGGHIERAPNATRSSRQQREPADPVTDRVSEHRPYFEVLIVDSIDPDEQAELRQRLLDARREEDEFVYDLVFVPSFEDAVIAVQFNHTIQSCVLRYTYPFYSESRHEVFDRYLDQMRAESPRRVYGLERSIELGRILKAMRSELDLFLVTDSPLEHVAGHLGRRFRRVFYRLDNYLELHLSILKGIRSRYETPFFDALRRYSQKPTGVFHALPIARGKSINNAHWVRDMSKFYGPNIFLAETSATSGGLDSLLQPHGPIKRAQDFAARAYNAQRTYFVTNGTSTANKIVVQALVRPGDIVLVSHDCHKSHHYALMLAGAYPVYLDAYPLQEYSFYGAVTLHDIKRQLLELKRAGKLDRVRMLLLTNCTFDGITYHPLRIMQEVLAIKPDIIFLWDEAWFAFAGFNTTLRQRTAMYAADRLRKRLHDPQYREAYRAWRDQFDALDADDDQTWLNPPEIPGTGRRGLMPDPDEAQVRVYVTQSTHKTLTALRQGSMIHVHDELFEQLAVDAFDEAFMTHTSTSPNYQIIASLDVGRRQVELEGYELVQKSISLAMALRERIYEHPIIRRYIKVLRPADLIPAEHRPSGLEFYYDRQQGWAKMEQAWREDEFALDPTRVTVHVGRLGVDGNSLRHVLMDDHDIQINKTSRNTLLFLTNIGMSRGDVAYLVEVLARLAQDLEENLGSCSMIERMRHLEVVAGLTERLPPLPNFSRFHNGFRPDADSSTPEGDIRKAFFLAYNASCVEYMPLDEAARVVAEGQDVVSAAFVTPYPPGFPVLVPGQIVSESILKYLNAVDVKEIHGYRPQYGLRIFTENALQRAAEADADQTLADVSNAIESEGVVDHGQTTNPATNR